MTRGERGATLRSGIEYNLQPSPQHVFHCATPCLHPIVNFFLHLFFQRDNTPTIFTRGPSPWGIVNPPWRSRPRKVIFFTFILRMTTEILVTFFESASLPPHPVDRSRARSRRFPEDKFGRDCERFFSSRRDYRDFFILI